MRYIDISKYQQSVDYEKLKNEVDGVIIRAVSTNSNGIYIDPLFEKHYRGCIAAAIPVGVYFYSYATTKQRVDSELNLVFDAIKGKTISLPVIIDVEDNSQKTIGKQALTDIVIHALERIENAGYYAMYYSYKNFYDNYLDKERLKKYDFWLAWYTTVYPSGYKFGMWQYTSAGKVAGINGNVDISNVYKDYQTIIKNAGLNNLTDAPQQDSCAELIKAFSAKLDEIEKIIDEIREMMI